MLRLLVTSLALYLCAHAAPHAGGANGPDGPWWRHAVFYEIYPRSFQDTEGDGVGDLNGITSRLGYLQDLGIDAIWLTPCFPSPLVDFGYDISDYRNIDPRLGTLADFDRLVEQARQRGIRVVLDLVLNHTSDQHPWFKESRLSRQSPKRDWFIWRDGKAPGQPPCNWLSLFGGPAWTLDSLTGQYYYHYFYKEQPDLNWRNPKVRQAMTDITRFWYQRGVAGFRLDSVDTLFEDPQLHDNPVLPGRNAYGDPNMLNIYNYKRQEVHPLLKNLRRTADEFGAVLIGETYTDSSEELKAFYGDGQDELQMPTGHMLAMAPSLSAPEFRARIKAAEATGCWPVEVLGNHDLARVLTRFGDGAHNEAIAKVLAALQLTLRGTPILYYGEELGMENNNPKRKEDVRDPQALVGWPNSIQRDGERTPMQWDAGPAAGFTTGRPWLANPPSSSAHNVEGERKDPASVLSFYRSLLALRRRSAALLDGDYRPLNTGDPNVLSYLRTVQDQAVLVVLNLTGQPHATSFNLAAQGWKGAQTNLLLAAGSSRQREGIPREVGPYAVVITSLAKPR